MLRRYFPCFIFLILLNVSTSTIPQQKLNIENVRSPLDDADYAQYYDDNIDVNQKPDKLIPSMNDISKLPSCQQPCMKHVTQAMGIAMKASNHYDRFYGVCEKYNETLACMEEAGDCASKQLFNILTSGLKYMCVDQRDAFEGTIECVDAAAPKVTGECNQQCNTQGKLANWAVQSGMLNGFKQGDKVPLLNPETMRGMMQDGCELADCHLGCMKTKFNNRCEGHAGNLISEMLVRPIGETQRGEPFKIISNIMGLFIPNQCKFIINEEQLVKFRIDPKIDQEVRQMYKDRKELDEVEDLVKQGADPKPSGPSDILQSPLDEKKELVPSEHQNSEVFDVSVDVPDVEVSSEPTPIVAVKQEISPEYIAEEDFVGSEPEEIDFNWGDLNGFPWDIHGAILKKLRPNIMFEDQESLLEEEEEEQLSEFPATIIFHVNVTPLPPGPNPLDPNPLERSFSGIFPPKSVKSLNYNQRLPLECSTKREFRRFYSTCNF